MPRFLQATVRAVLVAVAVLGLGTSGAQPVAAAGDGNTKASSSGLSATALLYGETRGVVLLTNTNASAAARVVLVVHDMTNALVGCGLQVLAPNEQTAMFISPTKANGTVVNGILQVQAYAFSAKKPLYAGQQAIDGLKGSLALVNGNNGQVADVSDMLESAASDIERMKDLDACFATGAASSLGADENVVTTSVPAALAPAAASSKSSKNSKR